MAMMRMPRRRELTERGRFDGDPRCGVLKHVTFHHHRPDLDAIVVCCPFWYLMQRFFGTIQYFYISVANPSPMESFSPPVLGNVLHGCRYVSRIITRLSSSNRMSISVSQIFTHSLNPVTAHRAPASIVAPSTITSPALDKTVSCVLPPTPCLRRHYPFNLRDYRSE